jgi:hypothetical protein
MKFVIPAFSGLRCKIINKGLRTQPTNITKKLPPDTNNNIKNVNKDKYEKNL